MDTLELIAEARALGLTICADGDLLRMRGPKVAEALALALLERKPEVMAIFGDEACAVAWRVEALRGHILARGPIVLPFIRPDTPRDAIARGLCSLCGDVLPMDPAPRFPRCVRHVCRCCGWPYMRHAKEPDPMNASRPHGTVLAAGTALVEHVLVLPPGAPSAYSGRLT